MPPHGKGYDSPVNLWVVVGILVLGAALALGPSVLSWLDPESPARAAARLIEVVSSWNRIRDAAAGVIVRGPEGEVRLNVAFLAPASLRITVEEPPALAGTVFALRPVGEEWIVVHHRPDLELGIEVRLSPEKWAEVIQELLPAKLPTALRRGEIRVTYTVSSESEAFDVRGLPGAFPRVRLWMDAVTLLPWLVELYTDPDAPPEVELVVPPGPTGIRAIAVNRGLELRDLFALDPYPTRWLVSPGK